MSILIPNMAMPKSCSKCTFGDGYACYATNLKVQDDDWENTRASSCPLVELPKHGRLIDADALDKHIYNDVPLKVFGNIARMANMRILIDDAPTIIESEGEDDSRRMEAKKSAN